MRELRASPLGEPLSVKQMAQLVEDCYREAHSQGHAVSSLPSSQASSLQAGSHVPDAQSTECGIAEMHGAASLPQQLKPAGSMHAVQVR